MKELSILILSLNLISCDNYDNKTKDAPEEINVQRSEDKYENSKSEQKRKADSEIANLNKQIKELQEKIKKEKRKKHYIEEELRKLIYNKSKEEIIKIFGKPNTRNVFNDYEEEWTYFGLLIDPLTELNNDVVIVFNTIINKTIKYRIL